ncbi:MAG: glycosyltransferase [Desulfobacterales bacterium]
MKPEKNLNHLDARDLVLLLQEKERKIVEMESELDEIKRSKSWRLIVFLRSFFYEKLLDKFPLIQKGFLSITQEGFGSFFMRTKSYFNRKAYGSKWGIFPSDYQKWIDQNEAGPELLLVKKSKLKQLTVTPRISIIMPVYNVDEIWLEKAIESVWSQLYQNWELCIADDASTRPHIREVIEKWINRDARIKAVFLKTNKGISGASNEALSLATGDFIGLLDNDDEISHDALFEITIALNENPDADMVYSDEDMLDKEGGRLNPYFKPDWSPDTLLSGNYITHFAVYRKTIVDEIGGFRIGYEGSQDYDLALRFTEKTDKIHHVCKILYHWRKIEGSAAASADAKNYAYVSAQKALKDALHRRKISGDILLGQGVGYYVVRREILHKPLITIVISALGNPDFLKRCITSIRKNTTWSPYEIIITANKEMADTESICATEALESCRVFSDRQIISLSAAYNIGAKHARGEHIVFLHDDVTVYSKEWLHRMLEHSQRTDVGAVGAKLIYPNHRIEHAGIILGIHGVAGNAYHNSLDHTEHYFGHLNIVKNYSAVSHACLMIKKEAFIKAGGFDEINLPWVYSDVDLCLRLLQQKLVNIYTPFAVLCHDRAEVKTHMSTQDDRDYMIGKWKDMIEKDPYYNPNLTTDKEDFSLLI